MPDENCSGAMGILHFWCHWQSGWKNFSNFSPLCTVARRGASAQWQWKNWKNFHTQISSKIAQWRGVAPLCQMKKMHDGAMYILHCAILAPLAVAAAAAVAHLAPLCHAICFVF